MTVYEFIILIIYCIEISILAYLFTTEIIHGIIDLTKENKHKKYKSVNKVAHPTIKNGDKGKNAKLLVDNLNYVMNLRLVYNGEFDSLCVEKLKLFQMQNGLTVDGIYGKNTYDKMDSIIYKMNKEI